MEALRGVTFSVAVGERVGLVGPNGAGKSTLLLALAGFVAAEGHIRVAGHTMSRATARNVRRHLGLVFQNPDDQLFMPHVGEDVAFGPLTMGLSADKVHARVHEALAAVSLEGFEGRIPYHLSDGEKRRAALATVLAMRPQILALDEPAANLDPRPPAADRPGAAAAEHAAPGGSRPRHDPRRVRADDHPGSRPRGNRRPVAGDSHRPGAP